MIGRPYLFPAYHSPPPKKQTPVYGAWLYLLFNYLPFTICDLPFAIYWFKTRCKQSLFSSFPWNYHALRTQIKGKGFVDSMFFYTFAQL